ncbi:hypothetical protein P5V15_002047 [Pogonomyrmex californicus]
MGAKDRCWISDNLVAERAPVPCVFDCCLRRSVLGKFFLKRRFPAGANSHDSVDAFLLTINYTPYRLVNSFEEIALDSFVHLRRPCELSKFIALRRQHSTVLDVFFNACVFHDCKTRQPRVSHRRRSALRNHLLLFVTFWYSLISVFKATIGTIFSKVSHFSLPQLLNF